jgi:hypothetical protein
MEKLKKVIEQYGRWSILSVYIDRIEAHIEADFSLSLENSKALLESIGREICSNKQRELAENSSVNGILKNAFSAMGYSNSNLVSQISGALATIAQQVGELRNNIGITSHGKTLEELKERNNQINFITREVLIDSIEIIGCFLIRIFENENPRVLVEPEEEKTISYDDAPDFNDFWDELFGDFEMGDYSYPASEVFYNVDPEAYMNEYRGFQENKNNIDL